MKKYVLYARLSTKESGKYGINDQIETMKKYVEDQNGVIVTILTERESGMNDDRPNLNIGIDICNKEKAILLIATLDRLSRSAKFILILKDELEKNKIPFEVGDTPNLMSMAPSDRTMHLGQRAIAAQWEREKIVERITRGLARAKEKGKILGRGTPKKTDEEIAKQKDSMRLNKEITCEKVERALVNVLPHLKGRLSSIVAFLNDKKVVSVNGSKWDVRKLIRYGFTIDKLVSLGMVYKAKRPYKCPKKK